MGWLLDKQVAEMVLGWQEWTPEMESTARQAPLFVVNPVTREIELCVQPTCLAPLYSTYPECARAYSFSTREDDARMIYQLLPVPLQDWRMTPYEICEKALAWKRMVS